MHSEIADPVEANLYRRYLRFLLVPLLAVLPLLGVSCAYLWKVGELTSIREIVRKQAQTGALYGTALYSDDYPYKLALARERKSDIVLLGSSRALPATEAMFRRSFMNLGRMATSTRHLPQSIDDLLAIANPSLVIVAIDFWWAVADTAEVRSSAPDRAEPPRLTPDALLAPMKWISEGKIGRADILGAIVGSSPLRFGDVAAIGVRAATFGTGFAPDGSRSDQDVVYGRIPARDRKFQFSLTEGLADWDGTRLDDARMERILAALRRLRDAGIPTVSILPPVAPTVYQAMTQQSSRFAAIWQTRRALAASSPEHFDFLDPATLETNDCEFLDGYHGGQIVFARMLQRLAAANADLTHFIDVPAVKGMIDCCSLTTTASDRFRRSSEKEVDFLNIGCEKRRRA